MSKDRANFNYLDAWRMGLAVDDYHDQVKHGTPRRAAHDTSES